MTDTGHDPDSLYWEGRYNRQVQQNRIIQKTLIDSMHEAGHLSKEVVKYRAMFWIALGSWVISHVLVYARHYW